MERASVISGGADKSPPAGISPTFSSLICLPLFMFSYRDIIYRVVIV